MKINTYQVHTKLPEKIRALWDLAMNLWFSWNDDALDIFIRLGYDPRNPTNYWDKSEQNPVKMLGMIPQETLIAAAEDESFVSNLNTVFTRFQDYLKRPTWFQRVYPDNRHLLTAYFSCEFGLDESLPVYSGGLGILSGDHLKSASDLGIPLVGVGLLYQEGYFQQYLNNDGWQQESYPTNDWYNMSVEPETQDSGQPVIVSVQLADDTVYCKVWRVQVGRIPLYLLDTNIPMNNPSNRIITHRLYGGDREMRIRQEIVLGIGGVRALQALKIVPTVYHINEGHSAFLTLERIHQLIKTQKLTYEEAWEATWSSNVFTTHTPVPAGNEHFAPDLIRKYFAGFAQELGMDIDRFLKIGQNGFACDFSMTILALRMSAFCNGVSRLHAETSRAMWHFLWPDLPVDEIPITHITNGIHTYSWIGSRMFGLLMQYLGPRFVDEPENPNVWLGIENIPDNELWRVHQLRREYLITFTRKRLMRQLKRRSAGLAEARHAQEVLNPHTLTIGFSRRFASYKRAALLFHNPERLAAMLHDIQMPVQIIFAGKAHPQDNPGKEIIREIVQFTTRPEFRDHIVFIENYDIQVARMMVQGVDVWLNTPRRPLEASGTSGMKAALNGVLNISVLDGWWCEGYGESNGWVIGSGEVYDDPDVQDDIESEALYRLLENDVIPLFYERDRAGLPRGWIKMMKSSMKNLGSFFNTHRMLIDYTERLYMHSSNQCKKMQNRKYKLARELGEWRRRITDEWNSLAVKGSWIDREREIVIGDKIKICASIELGDLKPSDIRVEAYYGKLDRNDQIVDGDTIALTAKEQTGDSWRYEGALTTRFNGRCGYSIRIIPDHPELAHPFMPSRIRWEEE
ncbi:alpha-glucan family phosphorylase [bacterium]|nr:alpha-glucan family phosphorylase [candidate division CSSED10-310 bacterium]